MDTGIVYHLFCTVNGKAYVGQTWESLTERWRKHLEYRSHCYHLNRALKKYGPDYFIRSILTFGLTTQEQMDAAERYWIEYFDCRKNGYNIKEGGSHGKHSEESKRKMSIAHTGHHMPEGFGELVRARMIGNQYSLGCTHSEETKAKMSKAHKGKGPLLGCKLSEEHRVAISNGLIGRVVSEETREKLSIANTGYRHTDEAKKKMEGRVVTEESKGKMSRAHVGIRASPLTRLKMRISHLQRKNMDNKKLKEELDRIAAEMKRPNANVERLSKEIDELLGTALPEENKSLAGSWERSRRRK